MIGLAIASPFIYLVVGVMVIALMAKISGEDSVIRFEKDDPIRLITIVLFWPLAVILEASFNLIGFSVYIVVCLFDSIRG